MKLLSLVCLGAAVAAGMATIAQPAEAHRRCGYDRGGYRGPDFSGCPRLRDDWDGEWRHERRRERVHYVRPRSYRVPLYGADYGVGPDCYFDRGWYEVILVCR